MLYRIYVKEPYAIESLISPALYCPEEYIPKVY